MSFLLEEGVLTVGALSGIFTTGLLNSLKRNIIDPSIEKVYPSHKLDKNGDEQFGDIFPLPMGTSTNPQYSTVIKWQTFLKDFITWIIIMFCLYLFWKKVLQPFRLRKMNSNLPNFNNK